MNNKEDSSLNNAIEVMNKVIPVSPESNKEVAKPIEEALIEPVKKVGRPTLMTDSIKKKIIELAEELFFIRAIAGEAGVSVDTIERELRGRSDENRRGNEQFALSFAYGQNKFIAYHQRKMMEYAENKQIADWRGEAHILTLCDKEYSERKYLTDAVTNQDAKILMQINAEKLVIAGEKGQKMLEGVNLEGFKGVEDISLKPFKPQKGKKKPKPKTVGNKGENDPTPPSQ